MSACKDTNKQINKSLTRRPDTPLFYCSSQLRIIRLHISDKINKTETQERTGMVRDCRMGGFGGCRVIIGCSKKRNRGGAVGVEGFLWGALGGG